MWTSDDPAYPRTDVYGSLDELERDFGVRPDDLHRPFIDELTRPNPDDPTGQLDHAPGAGGAGLLVRIRLDAVRPGALPVRESRTGSSDHYPGDFIVEYNGQTRGWFYTMHVLATALFDRPAFKTCMAHGIVLGDDGQKMSKSRRNYPDVGQVFDRDGSDAMRWFLMSSPILRGADLVVTEAGIRESVRQAVLPLWNAWYFLALYARRVGPGRAPGGRTPPTCWTGTCCPRPPNWSGTSLPRLDVYDLAGACASVRLYLEGLTNWYIRRSRQRFWDGDADAIDTLHTVLEVVCRVVAPLLPLTSEVIWRGLTGGRSVHLTDWPSDSGELAEDAELVAAMDEIREIASVALSVRKVAGPAGPAAAGVADRGDPRRGSAAALHVSAVRRGQRAGGGADRAGRPRRAGVPPAVGQRAGGRAPAGQGRAEGDQGVQGRGLVRRRRRHRGLRRVRAGRGGVHAGTGRRRVVVGRGRAAALRRVRLAGHRARRRTGRRRAR